MPLVGATSSRSSACERRRNERLRALAARSRNVRGRMLVLRSRACPRPRRTSTVGAELDSGALAWPLSAAEDRGASGSTAAARSQDAAYLLVRSGSDQRWPCEVRVLVGDLGQRADRAAITMPAARRLAADPARGVELVLACGRVRGRRRTSALARARRRAACAIAAGASAARRDARSRAAGPGQSGLRRTARSPGSPRILTTMQRTAIEACSGPRGQLGRPTPASRAVRTRPSDAPRPAAWPASAASVQDRRAEPIDQRCPSRRASDSSGGQRVEQERTSIQRPAGVTRVSVNAVVESRAVRAGGAGRHGSTRRHTLGRRCA